MNDHTQGIVLKQTDYRDHAILLTVLTKEYGKLSFVAQGARKLSSKTGSSVLPYTLVDFLLDYVDRKTIFRMKNANTKKYYKEIHHELELSACAAVLCEICDLLSYDAIDVDFEQQLFEQLQLALDQLEETKLHSLVLAVFMANAMKLFGIQPIIDECAICGKTNVVAVSAKEGGFLCAEHAQQFGVSPMSIDFLREFRYINKAELAQLKDLEPYITDIKKSLAIFVEMFEMHLGVHLRSYPFYESLLPIE